MQKEVPLSYFPKITPRRYRELITAFSSLARAWTAKFAELKKLGWEDNLIYEFLSWKDEVDEEKIQQTLQPEGIKTITLADLEYPPLLKEIYDPPFCLFVRGSINPQDFFVAVVGTRKATTYGQQVTEEIVRGLARQGVTIVSGLALGIDGFAHQAAIANHGRTVAVLGGGNDRQHVFPGAHRHLADQIVAEGGAVITEYPPATLPTNYSFPRRNRIIAGMSLGTLVVEAPADSGSLITARCALDYNREVFTIPQNITSATAVGPNNLIKMGAHPVTEANDILDALNLQNVKQYVANTEILPDSPAEAALLPHLSREPRHVDLLIKQSQLASPTVMSTLTLMEMKGKVRNLGGMMYVLSR